MAMIVDAFVGRYLEKLMDLIEERGTRLLGVKQDLQRLQRRLKNIKHVLADAEKKRIKSEAVDAWVKQLKEVMYDADDMIDLCKLKGAQLMLQEPSSVSNRLPLLSCCTTIPVRHVIGSTIKKINDRLDEISKNMSEFSFVHTKQDVNLTVTNGMMMNSRQTDGLRNRKTVGVEIEIATNKLVQKLLVRKQEQETCDIVVICGMGGIGKTTLAKNIFNDKRITFEVKVWLCVSQAYDKIQLLQQLIRGAGGDPGNATARAEMLPILENAVKGKDVFLVLDDVWQGQEEDLWNNFLGIPLQGGGPSNCRILITSRNENVAWKIGATQIHQVNKLSASSGWEMLSKLLLVNGEKKVIDSFKDLGLQLVEKCNGLPLAIKVISGMLISKRSNKLNRREWKKLIASESWSMFKNLECYEEVMGALFLSYEDLPSHLKQCFLYLSLFPEDFKYNKSDIIHLWVAEGFIKSDGSSLLEEIGEAYYEELINRNIIQAYENYDNNQIFTMHGILRSLGQYLSRDESYSDVSVEKINDITGLEFKVRRLCVASRNKDDIVINCYAMKALASHMESLRTLLCYEGPNFVENALVKLRYLRVSYLPKSGIECLPDSLGNLVHLRLIDLSGTCIFEVPESISRLTNLQTLNLSRCKSLFALPKGITELCSLRHLDLYETPLTHLPKGIRKLKQLNELSSQFIDGEDGDGCSLDEISSLSQLRQLRISHLGKAKVTDGSSIILANLPHLKHLELICTPSENYDPCNYSMRQRDDLKKLFELLLPPPCLDELTITRYYGHSFPDWLMQTELMFSHFSCLISLHLYECEMVSVLPPLGQLPHLESLTITKPSSVKYIGPELLGVPTSRAFPSLKYLSFVFVPKWEEWSLPAEPALLPCLYVLRLQDCPELRALPNSLGHCRHLQELFIYDCTELTSVCNLPHLTRELTVFYCPSLGIISSLPALRKLEVSYCSALNRVEGLDSLLELELTDDSMERLPDWLSGLIKKRTEDSPCIDLFLMLRCNIGVMRRCCVDCPDWPIIQQFSRVTAYEIGGNATFSYTAGLSGIYDFTRNFDIIQAQVSNDDDNAVMDNDEDLYVGR